MRLFYNFILLTLLTDPSDNDKLKLLLGGTFK